MNIVTIKRGVVNNVANIEYFKEFVGGLSFYQNGMWIGDVHYNDDICFNGRRFTFTCDTKDAILNQLRVHQHNSEIIKAVGNLK